MKLVKDLRFYHGIKIRGSIINTKKAKNVLLITLVFLIFSIAVYILYQPKVEKTRKRLNLTEIISIKNEEKKSIKSIQASADLGLTDSHVKSSDPLFWQNFYEKRNKISDDELRSLIEQDDICKFIVSSIPLKEGVLALAKAPDKIKVDVEKDIMLEELFGGVMEGVKSKNEHANIILDFYNALLFADLIDPVQGSYKDLSKADTILNDLQARDPSNGAYAFFRAYVLHKKNADAEQIRNEFLKSFRAPHFDSFITAITKRILEKSFGGSVYYHLGLESIRQMPIPSYNSVYFLLRDLLKSSNIAFNQEAGNLGLKMMEPGLRVRGEREFVNWVALEYAIGFHILKNSSKIAFPELSKKMYKDDTKPSLANLTQVQTLLNESTKNKVNFDRALNKLTDETGCLRQDYDIAVKEDEQQYLNFLKQADFN